MSGTYGITGSVDTIVVIRRKRNEAFGTIHVTGRDVADEEIPARFDELAWTAAPGTLSAASFERTEVYRVIEERGPIFPQAIADLIGKSRQNVQNMVNGLVQTGAIARTGRGYVTAAVVIDTAPDGRIPLSLPRVSSDSERHQGHAGHTPAGAREDGPVLRIVPPAADVHVRCDFYHDHQLTHARGRDGQYHCPTCSPEEDPSA